MELSVRNGALQISCNGMSVGDVSARLECYGNKANFLDICCNEWRVDGYLAVSETDGGTFRLRIGQNDRSGICIDASFIAERDIKNVLRLCVYGVLPHEIAATVYNTSTASTGNRRSLDMCANSKTALLTGGQTVLGCDYIAYKAKDGFYGVIGAVTFDNFFSSAELSDDGTFKLYVDCNEHWRDMGSFSLKSGEEIVSDRFLIAEQADNSDILSVYGNAIAQSCGARKRRENPSGWCSWYYYGPNISEDCILENMRVARRENLPFRYIQIDDGWQKAYGDWTANDKFPHGMKHVADEIRKNGFLPGIWIAPLAFSQESELYRSHSDWFIRGADFISGSREFLIFPLRRCRTGFTALCKRSRAIGDFAM